MKPSAICLAGLMLAIPGTLWAADQTVTLSVPDMNCPACPITVKKALTRLDGVSEVRVDYAGRTVQVGYDDQRVDIDALTRATRDAGYPSSAVGEME